MVFGGIPRAILRVLLYFAFWVLKRAIGFHLFSGAKTQQNEKGGWIDYIKLNCRIQSFFEFALNQVAEKSKGFRDA